MIFRNTIKTLRQFRDSNNGAAGFVFAAASPVILGVAGLAIDYSIWEKEKIALQRISDSAVVAAAYAKAKGATNLEPYAIADATLNGFDAARESLVLTVVDDAIRVDMQRKSRRFLSTVITQDAVLINVTAQADVEASDAMTSTAASSGGYACITALQDQPNQSRGIYMHNTAHIDATDCGVHSNSTRTKKNNWTEEGSIYLRNAHINSEYVRAVGEVVVNDWNGNSTTSVATESNAAAFVDPFAGLTPPTAGSCDNNGRTVNYVPTPEQLQPGTYCGDIIIQNGGKATFAPGVYHLVNGDLIVRGGASVFDSDGVTFYFGGNNAGKWIINNGTDVRFSAPVGGDTSGMLFWQSADAHCDSGYNGQNKFAGGARFEFDGVIYAPGCGLVIDNNAHLSPSSEDAHMSVHAAWIEMKGSARITVYGAPADADLASSTGYAESAAPAQTASNTDAKPRLRFVQ